MAPPKKNLVQVLLGIFIVNRALIGFSLALFGFREVLLGFSEFDSV